MGLLDDFSSFIKTPEGMGLLSAVAGGLAGAQRGAPINSLGRAGLAGVMGYGNALDRQERTNENAVQNQFRQMQLAEMKRKQDAIAALGQNVPEQMRPFVDVAPEAVIKSMFKEPDKPQLVTVEGSDGKPMQRWIKPGEAQGVDIGAAPNKEAALPWYARKGQDGKLSIDPAFAELERMKAANSRPPAQPMAPVAYQDPATGQVVWGTITEAKGKPAANFSPTIQGQIAGAKEGAKTMAEETTKAALDAPRVIDNATTALKYSDELLKHPGFSQAVGKSSMLGIQKIPGTEGRDFMNRLDQLKGGAFLEAFNTLKGGGQITEVEGKKATDAIARMDNATSEEEFKTAVKDYQDVIRKGMNRAKMKAKPIAPVLQQQQGGVKFLGFE